MDDITIETAARHKANGSRPLGPAAILAQDPFAQPVKTKRSFAPRVHAFSREIRKTRIGWNLFRGTFSGRLGRDRGTPDVVI